MATQRSQENPDYAAGEYGHFAHDPGATPSDNSDLSSNPNPYSDGRRNHDDLTGSTGDGFTSTPAGYWSRGVSGSMTPGTNLDAGGAGIYSPGEADAARYMHERFDALYGDIGQNRQPGGPTASEYFTDAGFTKTGH